MVRDDDWTVGARVDPLGVRSSSSMRHASKKLLPSPAIQSGVGLGSSGSSLGRKTKIGAVRSAEESSLSMALVAGLGLRWFTSTFTLLLGAIAGCDLISH
jgi:hypothetical protein